MALLLQLKLEKIKQVLELRESLLQRMVLLQKMVQLQPMEKKLHKLKEVIQVVHLLVPSGVLRYQSVYAGSTEKTASVPMRELLISELLTGKTGCYSLQVSQLELLLQTLRDMETCAWLQC